ncbi:hypothetical protein LJR220_002564 [Bradyrhizobium sp. LjRoot220]|uniref:hypothetical protein n=1 Tax=Bradyrhizobium sp. LjRoot220 TaxID=3342284 RepID=UPI003ECD4EC2
MAAPAEQASFAGAVDDSLLRLASHWEMAAKLLKSLNGIFRFFQMRFEIVK